MAVLVGIAGLVVTLAAPLPLVVAGIALMTAGWFAAHGVASGWVSARAHLGGGGTGQASSYYLFAYYLGSSVFGGLSGLAWTAGGWGQVVLVVGALMGVSLVAALVLRRIPSLSEAPREGRDPIAQ